MSANNKFKPIALKDIKNFHQKIKDKEPFCFVRYSDGETEIIKNRYLTISLILIQKSLIPILILI